LLIPTGQRIVCRDHATLRQWRTTQRDASAPAFASADQSPVICLSTFLAITPLGARIDDLEKEGYVFEVEHEHGDYVYRLVSALASKRLTS